jgi:hypothetical protein
VACTQKKARRQRRWLVFIDESGFSQRPAIRRTWAPKGETPVLIHAFNWKRMSAAAALAYRWDGRRSRLFFQLKPGSYNTESLIGFLKGLKRAMRGCPCLLIWDGLPAHKSRLMQEHLRRERHWLHVEPLPAYAPDLNPVETLWSNVKGRELANLCAADLGVAAKAARRGLARVARYPTLAKAFLAHAGLTL